MYASPALDIVNILKSHKKIAYIVQRILILYSATPGDQSSPGCADRARKTIKAVPITRRTGCPNQWPNV